MQKPPSGKRRRAFARLDAACAGLNDLLLAFAVILTAFTLALQVAHDIVGPGAEGPDAVIAADPEP